MDSAKARKAYIGYFTFVYNLLYRGRRAVPLQSSLFSQISYYAFAAPRCRRRHFVFGLSVRRVRLFVRSFVHSFIRPDRSCYHVISWTAWTILTKLTGSYWLAPDDLIRFWRSKVKVTVGRRGGEAIYVDASRNQSSIVTNALCCQCFVVVIGKRCPFSPVLGNRKRHRVVCGKFADESFRVTEIKVNWAAVWTCQ